MQIFCDMDGVLADFDAGVELFFSRRPSEMDEDFMWRQIQSKGSDFWMALPVMPRAIELWAGIAPYDPVILTGCPKIRDEHYNKTDKMNVIAAESKMKWAMHYLGPKVHVIACKTEDKPLHMKNAGDILIDDFESNCQAWREVGGSAFRYDPSKTSQIVNTVQIIKGHYSKQAA